MAGTCNIISRCEKAGAPVLTESARDMNMMINVVFENVNSVWTNDINPMTK